MITRVRPTDAPDGTTLQGSVLSDPQDYKALSMTSLMLGIVLEVYPSDRDENRSAVQAVDRQGYRHECTVLILDDGSAAYTVMENVVIPPQGPSGLDDYNEKLPRAASIQVNGEELDSSLHQIDPYDLDGDWCVIAFVGGRLDHPFVLSWWPHVRNPLDAATSGHGSEGRALVQEGRYFSRVNGIETVITSKGDIIFSTTWANSSLAPGAESTEGRFGRNPDEETGGSIRVNVKPSQSFELTFNPQEEGIGALDVTEPEMPQRNPAEEDPAASSERNETYLYMDRDQIDIFIPGSFTVDVADIVKITAGDEIQIYATNILTHDAALIVIGADAADDEALVLGEQLRVWLESTCKVLSPFGPLSIDPLTTIRATTFAPPLSTKTIVE